MKTPLLQPLGPFLKLLVLLFIAFVSVSLFVLLGSTLVQLIWGFDLYENIAALSDYSIPQVIHANKLLLLLQHVGMFVLPPLVFAQLVSKNSFEYLLLKRPETTWHWALALAVMFLALLPINLLVEWNAAIELPASAKWLEEILKSAENQAAELTEALLSDVSVTALVVNVLLIAVIPAIGEELMFRGAIQRLLSQWTGSYHAGIWASALLFSALHFQFYGFLPRLALGALFGYMVIWSGSLWLPIAAHFINNFTAVLLVFSINRGALPETADTAGTGEVGIYVSLVSAALLLILLRLWMRTSRWSVFKSRYFSP